MHWRAMDAPTAERPDYRPAHPTVNVIRPLAIAGRNPKRAVPASAENKLGGLVARASGFNPVQT
jgi:hypothetical protein